MRMAYKGSDCSTCLFIDHRWTFPSPPPLARLARSAPCVNVAWGCHAMPPTRSLWPKHSRYRRISALRRIYKPRKERIGVQAGTFHSLTVPDQLPVASISLLGVNRTCDIGRSSPICEPRLAYLCIKDQWAHLHHEAYNVLSRQRKPFSEYQQFDPGPFCCLFAVGRCAFELCKRSTEQIECSKHLELHLSVA
jgi:hypothetical protein